MPECLISTPNLSSGSAETIVCSVAGHIIEHGAHEELLEENGLYARLFSAQV